MKTLSGPIRLFGSSMAADIVFIVNPASANGRMRRRWKTYERAFRRELGTAFEVRTTDHSGHAIDLTRAALGEGTTTIVSVGGDGTLNEVVNGYLRHRENTRNTDARLAVFSGGTGADFVRTLPMPQTPAAFARILHHQEPQKIDVGLCEFLDHGTRRARYFVNVAEFGSGGAVVDRVNRSTKILGGRLSFVIAILRTLPRYRNTRVAYEADGGPAKEVVVNDFVVANGRYFGAGLMPAPAADLADGLLDVVIFGDIDFKTARRNLPALRRGEHLSLEEVTTFRCRALTIRSAEEMIDLDGEFVGRHPLRFEVLPSALSILAE
jgi:YegS/Rv2252/BmrU family lipid kinase